MAAEFTLPELGENVEKGDVIHVLVGVGDVVRRDQPVLELETDKATIEVPSSVSGRVTDIRVRPGDKVKVGQVVLVVEESGAAADAPKGGGGAPRPATVNAVASDGDTGAIPVAPPAAASPAAAPAAAARAAEPAPARPAEERRASVVDISAGRHAAAAAPARLEEPVPAAPSVRRFARELGVDLSNVAGTGPGGRIGPEDVKQHVKATLSSGGGAAAAEPLPDFTRWGEVEVRPMSNIRRKTAEHLSAAWTAPHVTQHDKADLAAFQQLRAAYGVRVEQSGGKLTITAVVIRIVAEAIGRYPQFASSVDMAAGAIVYKKYCHIGVAVDTPNGLLVPVIRDANRKTITEIAIELGALSRKARDKKLGLEEMAGSVFSITNLGGIGGTAFTPIVNRPEVAILGMSRGGIEPVWRDGQFVPREMLPLSLSYDHRVIDGADAARFLRFVAEALEQPLTLLL